MLEYRKLIVTEYILDAMPAGEIVTSGDGNRYIRLASFSPPKTIPTDLCVSTITENANRNT